MPLLDEKLSRQRASTTNTKKHASAASQRQKTSASIVTQKTTLPQIETIAQRDQIYQVRNFFSNHFLQVMIVRF